MPNVEEETVLGWQTLTRVGVGTVHLPGGWSWDPRPYTHLTPDGSPVVMYEALEDDGDGHVYYDGWDYLKEECCDYPAVRQCVIDANKPTIDKIMSMCCAAADARESKKSVKQPVKKTDRQRFEAFLDDLNDLQRKHGIEVGNGSVNVILSMKEDPIELTIEDTFIGGNWVEIF